MLSRHFSCTFSRVYHSSITLAASGWSISSTTSGSFTSFCMELWPQWDAMRCEIPCLKIRHSVKPSKVALAETLWADKGNTHQIICLFWWEQMVSPSRMDRAQCSQLAIKWSVVQEVVPYLGLSVRLCCQQGQHWEAAEARSTSAGWSPYWNPWKTSNLATWSLCKHAFLVRTWVIDDKASQISTGWVTFPIWFLVPLPWWMISDGHWCVI